MSGFSQFVGAIAGQVASRVIMNKVANVGLGQEPGYKLPIPVPGGAQVDRQPGEPPASRFKIPNWMFFTGYGALLWYAAKATAPMEAPDLGAVQREMFDPEQMEIDYYADAFENDQSPDPLTLLTAGYPAETHPLYKSYSSLSGDLDYASFDAVEGQQYIVKTQNLKNGADTTLRIFKPTGVAFLTNDNDGTTLASEISFTAYTTGVFHDNIVFVARYPCVPEGDILCVLHKNADASEIPLFLRRGTQMRTAKVNLDILPGNLDCAS